MIIIGSLRLGAVMAPPTELAKILTFSLLLSVSHVWILSRTFWLGFSDQKITHQQLKAKSTFCITPRGKYVHSGYDFFLPFTSSWRTMDRGERWRFKAEFGFLFCCSVVPKAYSSSPKPSNPVSSWSMPTSHTVLLLSFSMAWSLSSPPQS